MTKYAHLQQDHNELFHSNAVLQQSYAASQFANLRPQYCNMGSDLDSGMTSAIDGTAQIHRSMPLSSQSLTAYCAVLQA